VIRKTKQLYGVSYSTMTGMSFMPEHLCLSGSNVSLSQWPLACPQNGKNHEIAVGGVSAGESLAVFASKNILDVDL
jgi:hypothetical protein